MERESSLNQSIDGAAKHYSSMFTLPSFKKALSLVAVVCVFAVGLSTFAVFPSIQGLVNGLVLGVSLFGLTLVADIIVNKRVLRNDSIFSLRRILVISLFSWVFWFLFIIIGVTLSFLFGSLLWVKLCLVGYAGIITLRIIVLMATSTASIWKKVLTVLIQPVVCQAAFIVFWFGTLNAFPLLQVVLFMVISPIIGFFGVTLLFSSVERLSKKKYSMSALILFRAFIVNWVTGQNGPLEKYLEDMGEDADIEVSLLKFDSSKPKAAIIVPCVHPGPFKNIGSSLLPSLLKAGFEKECGCQTCTPLGILGHELDLASQEANYKVISQVIASAKFESTASVASPFVRVVEGAATASSQIFGDTVFISFTLAPKTTEDLPQELGRFVSEEAAKYGLKSALVVNTHNSLTALVDTQEHVGELRIAASKCLQEAVRLTKKTFLVGSASVYPKEFSLKDGMGTGGITAVVIQVDDQKTAYVVIDGNNMIPDLREKIIAALTSAGFGESEVFTTDTHAVSALVTGRRGYHPVGEVMDQELLMRYIVEVAKEAEVTLEASKAGFLSLVVPKVRVIGEDRLKSITLLVDEGIQKIKRTIIPVFGLEGLLLVLLLLLF